MMIRSTLTHPLMLVKSPFSFAESMSNIACRRIIATQLGKSSVCLVRSLKNRYNTMHLGGKHHHHHEMDVQQAQHTSNNKARVGAWMNG